VVGAQDIADGYWLGSWMMTEETRDVADGHAYHLKKEMEVWVGPTERKRLRKVCDTATDWEGG